MSASYSRADLLQQIRDTINEPTARIFTDGQINNFIDMGARMCSWLSWGADAVEDETVIEATWKYQIGTKKFVKITSINYVDDPAGTPIEYGMQKIRPEQFGHNLPITEDIPKFYFTHALQTSLNVYIYPVPTAAMVSGSDVIRVRGYEVVADFGAGASETLPDELQFIPYFYALASVYATLGEHRLSAYNLSLFVDACNTFRADKLAFLEPSTQDMTKIPDVVVPSQ